MPKSCEQFVKPIDPVDQINEQQSSEESVQEISRELRETRELWRQAAKERFDIDDFDLMEFKRDEFDQSKVAAAFASGHEWNYIVDNLNHFIQNQSFNQATKSFEAMDELEAERPGSVKELHEKFGITNFQRYPREILLKQLDNQDKNKDLGLMVFATSDWNGAFDDQKEIWNKIYEHKKNDLNFRIVECKSNFALARQLIKSKNDFQKKISFLTISAHSEPVGFYLASMEEKRGLVDKEKILNLSSKMKEMFSEDAQVIGNACSSGAVHSWLESLSKEAGIKTIGPDRPAAIEDVEFKGKDVFPVYYNSEIYQEFNKGILIN